MSILPDSTELDRPDLRHGGHGPLGIGWVEPGPGTSETPAIWSGGVLRRLCTLAAERGSQPAYLDARGCEVATWAGIARQAASWAELLAPGSVVALRATSAVAFCQAYLAALAAGVCVAPLDPRATADELAAQLDLLEIVDVVVDGAEAAADLETPALNVWITTPVGLRRVWRATALRQGAPGVAVLLPTSGTTGPSKLVPLTEDQLLGVASRVVAHHGLTERDRGYSPLPLFHVNGQVVGVLSTLLAGSSLVVEDRFHRAQFWGAAEELGATWVNLVPALLGTLSGEAPPSDDVARRIRFARSASAPLPVAVLERFEARSGIAVLETYGMTEAASQIAANPLLESERRPGSVGRPFGVALRVVGEEGEEVPTGEPGVVEIGGPTVVPYYLGRGRSPVPARTAAGWLRTGDLARRDAQGFLYLLGRTDDVINRGGEKYAPREIEEVLRRDPRVLEVTVVGRPHPVLGEEPVAYVVAESSDALPSAVLAEQLRSGCRRSLSRYKQPASIILVDSLPTGRTGKVSRHRLRALAACQHPATGPQERHDEQEHEEQKEHAS